MTFKYVIFDDINAKDLATEMELSASDNYLLVTTKSEFDAYLDANEITDVALCDLRWVEQDGLSRGSFDGLDILLELELRKLCRHAIVVSDGGEAYRNWIEEAERSPIVAGGILRRNSDRPESLRSIVDGIRAGVRYWDLMEVREARPNEPSIVMDLLGRDDFLTDGDLIRVMLDGTRYSDLARGRFVEKNRIKKQVPDLIPKLRAIGEHLPDDEPKDQLVHWVAGARDYLLGWRRRVQRRLQFAQDAESAKRG